MWLTRFISPISYLASWSFYRLTISGGTVTPDGPALIVANHPNSLLDPTLVAAAAKRPVRFLAKAPLFSDKRIGFLVRGAGSIPVYRKMDDPNTPTEANEDMFRAAFAALAKGSAIALFPEGTSHSEPSISPLKTGAARIALGTFERTKTNFPIIPVGLVLKQKDVFRSSALVVVGEPIEWDDLAPLGKDNRDAARELTQRIDTAIREITVNLDTWDDQPLVECAERIWSAEFETGTGAAEKLGRMRVASDLIPSVRKSKDIATQDLLRDVESHRQELHLLHLSPADLSTDIRIRTALRWTLGRLYLLGPPSLLIALLGFVLFFVPYRTTGFIAKRSGADDAEISTWKLFIGTTFYSVWIGLLSALILFRFGVLAGISFLLLAPVIGATGLWLRERWRGASNEMRLFFRVRGRADLINGLRRRQAEIANRMAELVRYL
jgi:glycerol-3-phosphate O-acyltransferase/dihydroxyacetone phosphate acyltransferase